MAGKKAADKATEAGAATESTQVEANEPKLDETIPGGRYLQKIGDKTVFVNANGEPIE